MTSKPQLVKDEQLIDKKATQLVKDEQLIVETSQVMYDSVMDNVINYVTSALSKRGISLNQYLRFMYQTMDEFKEIEKLLVGLNKMADDYYQEKTYWGRRILSIKREKNYDKQRSIKKDIQYRC